jgi:hypothetical protein
MKTSLNGGVTMSGIGVKEVQERIQAEFEKARRTVPVTVRTQTIQERPLAAVAAPVLRAAENRFKGTTVRHAHLRDAHLIVVPKESAAELFTLCERAVSKLNIFSPRDDRHEVSE